MHASRREFLWLSAAAATLSAAPDRKPLRGIFPIAQTPFTDGDKLDTKALVAQLEFIDRGKVHGFVWPQLASEWSTLSEAERLEGAEAIAAAGKHLRPAIVLGVQGPDTAAAVRYAKHAAKVGADAIISLPPSGAKDPAALLEYYRAVGSATELPLFIQAVGDLSVESLAAISKAVPTARYVKDEAGQPLARIGELRRTTNDSMKVFTGGHGRTLIDEMQRGFSGSMPAASFSDVYAAVWDLWHEGKKKEALDRFATISSLLSAVQAYGIPSLKYMLELRGVFPNHRTRERPKGPNALPLDDTGKQVIRQLMDHARPHFRA